MSSTTELNYKELYEQLLKEHKELKERFSDKAYEAEQMAEVIVSSGMQDELPELFCDDEEEEDLSCIKCKTKIKENSKEHDYCILVNDGEDLVCVDCADK